MVEPPPGFDSWINFLEAFGFIWGMAMLGRIAYHIRLVKRGRRRCLSLALIWELPLAAFCGLAGAGLAEHFALTGWQNAALISVVAYLGPGGIEDMIDRALAYYGKGGKK